MDEEYTTAEAILYAFIIALVVCGVIFLFETLVQ